jgi:LmbE family N-acetylglucosaminyl deacetylase
MKRKIQRDSVLVVVAHPDDETLGLGGTIVKHRQEGREVLALSLTDGVGARGTGVRLSEVDRRNKAADLAAATLGFSWYKRASLPDNALDTVPLLEIVRLIETAKRDIAPTLVYTHFPHDLNVDHRVVCQAVMTAFRPQPGEKCSEIRACEIPSSTDYGATIASEVFNPTLTVSITNSWTKKLKALKAYASEMRDYPHSRSYKALEALAISRGASVGLPMAEGFVLLRKIER